MFIAEIVENRHAYKPNQKDDDGNPLPLGSVQIRIGGMGSNLGQVRNVFARPANFSYRIPQIGEHVLVISAPVNDWSTASIKNTGFLYICPVNSTDDLALHAFPRIFKRSNNVGGGSSGQRKHDKGEFGYTFPKTPKRTFPIQPFDGDEIYQGRWGQSIRFGSTVDGDMSVYDKKPNWKDGTNTDPIIIIRNKKPDGGTVQVPEPTEIQRSTNEYTIEDIDTDDSSIYMTSTQKLLKLKGGFDKNLDVKKLATFSTTSQIVVNSGRVVLNATKDSVFVIGKDSAVITGKQVILQSEKYKVDIDVLIDYIKDHVDADKDLAQGTKNYATPAGPTAASTNVTDYVQLSTTKFQEFKKP